MTLLVCLPQETSLFRHKCNVHTSEKPYKCDFPGYKYASAVKADLVIHKHTHTGEKLCKCDFPGCKYASE